MNWLDLIVKLVPIIIELINPKLAPLTWQVAGAINSSEKLPKGLSSQEKLDHATAIVMNNHDLTPTEVKDVQEVISKAVDSANILTGK